MYELIQVSNNSYYVNCPAKIGIYRCEDNGVYLIDSGNDKEAGRKVRQILDKNGWTLRAILVTHSNADHIEKVTRQGNELKALGQSLRGQLPRVGTLRHEKLVPQCLRGITAV